MRRIQYHNCRVEAWETYVPHRIYAIQPGDEHLHQAWTETYDDGLPARAIWLDDAPARKSKKKDD